LQSVGKRPPTDCKSAGASLLEHRSLSLSKGLAAGRPFDRLRDREIEGSKGENGNWENERISYEKGFEVVDLFIRWIDGGDGLP